MDRLLMLLALPIEIQTQYYARLRSTFPDLPISLVDHHSKVDPYIENATILMTYGPMLSDHVVRDAVNLMWIQALGTGVDNLIDLPSLRPEVMITNVHGIHGAAMSEAAIMAMLALSRDFPRVIRNQDQHKWERWPAQLLEAKTLGILGVGAIAEELALRCQALRMRVVGVSSAQREVGGFDHVYAREELVRAVSTFDFFLVLTPYSSATRNIVNGDIFRAMKPGSYFINLARGGVVDEAALMNSLQTGQLAGAALDVFNEEPLPAGHPLWGFKNVVITPHLAGFDDGYAARALPTVIENIRRFLAGDTANMINVVRR
jgi:D-2-hydroxyacid dehydrogenase (NADP+)